MERLAGKIRLTIRISDHGKATWNVNDCPKNGAEYPTRTDDLPLTRRLLYQLS